MSPARTRGDTQARRTSRSSGQLERGHSPMPGARGGTPTSRCRARTAPRWPPRTSSCWRRRPTCSAATTSRWRRSSAPTTRTSTPASRSAPRAARSGSASTSRPAGEMGARHRLARPRAAAARARGARLRRAGLSAAAASCSSTRRRATSRPRSTRGRRPPRSASASATRTCSRSPCTTQGHCWSSRAGSTEGLALLDEAMVAVTAGELSPIVDGHRLLRRDRGCQDGVRAAARAGVDGGADAVVRATARPGRVHRHVPGASRRDHAAARRLAGGARGGAAGRASAVAQAHERAARPVRRSTGRASCTGCGASSRRPRRPTGRRAGCGREPQPGLALLRLAQGKREAAAAAIRRAVGETAEPLERAALLPAFVEIMLAVGDVDAARGRLRRARRRSPARYESDDARRDGRRRRAGRSRWPRATRAPRSSRCARAWRSWQELDAPYEAARARVLVGLACRALGDEDAAALELDAARGVFEQLGAAPDLARVDAPDGRAARHARADAARAGGAAAGRRRQDQPGDRRGARDQRAHRRPPRAEHLRQARRLVAHRGRRVRLRARPRLTPAAWSEYDHAGASRRVGGSRRCGAARGRPYRRPRRPREKELRCDGRRSGSRR